MLPCSYNQRDYNHRQVRVYGVGPKRADAGVSIEALE